MSLSDRIRPNSEAAPWVIEEVKKLESKLAGYEHGNRFIHTVTTIPHHPEDERRHTYSSRCWGFFNTREEALDGLHHHVDSEAGYYNERFLEGIYAKADHEEWFKYDFDNHKWVKIPTPEFAVGIINHGIG
jgi:hypothetical protein